MLKIKIFLLIWFYKWFYGFGNISVNTVYSQSYHETNNFTSEVFKQNKNLFGMREAKTRKNLATGHNLGHATYESVADSIQDYFIRQKYFKIDNSSNVNFMVSTVKSGYAEDPNYLQKWKVIKSQNEKPQFLNAVVSGGAILVLFGLYLIFKKRK